MALTAGDLVPNITMPGPQGERVELGARWRAGYVQVVGFADAATAGPMVAALQAHRATLAALDAVVAVSAPAGCWTAMPAADWPVAMAERDFQLAQALGAAPPCLWVVDQARRLVETLPWSELRLRTPSRWPNGWRGARRRRPCRCRRRCW
ncbi:MAG: hypothetical protein R3F55_15720 [Alphaproteobacteria bacterium]